MGSFVLSNKTLKRFVIDTVRQSEPIEPRCVHARECGGCAFQDRDYKAQLAVKAEALWQIWDTALAGVVNMPIPVVASPDPFEYRTRMDYVASRGKMGLRRSGKFNWIVDLHECHLIPPSDFAVARAVYEHAIGLGLPDYNLRANEGFLRYFVVRRSPQGTLMLAVVTNSTEHASEMEQLAEVALSHEHVVSFHWLLNDKLTDLSFGEPIRYWGQERLPMQVGARMLEIGPNTFFQNNIHLLLPLLDAVADAVTTKPDGMHVRGASVADLYGGVGTIALHLAERVGHVVCVEEFAESAALAQHNVELNNVANVTTVAADTLAYLREQPVGAFSVVVVDPPRTGLGLEVSRELLRLAPERIVYVSCNPLTQVEDARTLLEGYTLNSIQGYDMFPHTPHLESLAIFDRK